MSELPPQIPFTRISFHSKERYHDQVEEILHYLNLTNHMAVYRYIIHFLCQHAPQRPCQSFKEWLKKFETLMFDSNDLNLVI